MAVWEVFQSWSMRGNVTLTNEGADALCGNPSFTQNAHGFAVGDVVYRDSATTHAKAQADSVANIGQGLALVVYVPDVNTFSILRVSSNHKVKIASHGLGAFGAQIFLSAATAGAMTATAPSPGWRIYLGFVIDDDHIHWEPGWVRY